MQADHPKPIYSSRAGDPSIDEAVDRFVIGLGESIDRLQDSELAGDLEQLGTQARALADEAKETGYSDLSRAASMLVAACRDRDAKLAREATLELTDLAQRVRLGHKGAA
jgi:hypothetical protein